MNSLSSIWKKSLQLITHRGPLCQEVLLLLLASTIVLSAPAVAEAGTWGEVAKLTASDAAADDFFGVSVAISGDTAVVSAIGDDDEGTSSGSVYVFERNKDGSWTEIKKLTASDAAAGDSFGRSVAISGDTVVVGATGNDDADPDNLFANSGSAYVFDRDQGGADNWGEVKKLTASDKANGDQFGISVAISGDTVVVAAIGDDDKGNFSGSAYVFDRNQGGADNWGEVQKLLASDGVANDNFAGAVTISGDTVVVGARQDRPGGTGSAYVFDRDQGGADNWGEVKKLTANDAAEGDWFGFSVAISDDTVVVGARFNDDAGNSSGSAYVFDRDQGGADNWGEVQKLTASDAAENDNFGFSVAISDDTVVVGAHFNDDADPSNTNANSGSAYMFDRDQGGADNWGEVQKLTASDATARDEFGHSVAISGKAAVFGARNNDEAGDNSGSAYVFELKSSLDHFLCYKAWGRKVNVRVDLDDQFGFEERVKVKRPKLFCNPVAKTHDDKTTEIGDETAHLTGYEIKNRGKKIKRRVTLKNQFDEQEQTVKVEKPKLLLVPTRKLSVDGEPTGLEKPEDLDHFKCYEVKKGRKANVRVDLEDQFGVEERVKVKRPKLFCNPVNKNGEGIVDPTAHLTCYEIKLQRHRRWRRWRSARRDVAVQNQFGGQDLRVVGSRTQTLCVPSTKIAFEVIVRDRDDDDDDDDDDHKKKRKKDDDDDDDDKRKKREKDDDDDD